MEQVSTLRNSKPAEAYSGFEFSVGLLGALKNRNSLGPVKMQGDSIIDDPVAFASAKKIPPHVLHTYLPVSSGNTLSPYPSYPSYIHAIFSNPL